jgi:alpha-mannosidase
MITVHMIGNAHLDPVWLWRKSDGVDAALATARSACDRLDEYPQFVFTCSSSWFHQQVERHDPALFGRIRRFVELGRWQIVGGMVIEPDCNLPAAESFARQLSAGQAYFRQKLGRPASVGYNIDSFGHTAYMPRFLQQAGLDAYVFMRPGAHEKELPARLFRWRSPDGYEVTAFRIAGAYAAGAAELREHVERSLRDLPEGVEETMCFYGVGDHGGGPTRAQIEWIAAHGDAVDGARLIFSHPAAFFEAIEPLLDGLPVVEGELQHHAIGCYSVERRIKVAMRRAEARLVQAGRTLDALGEHAPADAKQTLDAAWQKLLFHQFHDILGGTCLAPQSLLASAELLEAASTAEALITAVTRRAFRAAAEPGAHKVVAFNPSDEPFEGCVEHEPWLQSGGHGDLTLLDEEGQPLPFQDVAPQAMVALRRLLLRLSIPPRGVRVLQLVQAASPPAEARPLAPGEAAPAAGTAEPCPCRLPDVSVLEPEAFGVSGWTAAVELYDDPTDTWSHSSGSRFAGEKVGAVAWEAAPEVFSAGADEAGVSLTLLRSPYAAHHDPFPAGARPDQPVTDQGSHEFELLFWAACDADSRAVERLARRMQHPPIVWDLTG